MTNYRSKLLWRSSRGDQDTTPGELSDRELMGELVYFLNIREESDNGRVFRPNSISSVRVMDGSILSQIMAEMERRVPSD